MVSLNVASCATCASSLVSTKPSSAACVCSVSAKRSTWASLLASSWASMFSLDVTSCTSSLVSTKPSVACVAIANRASASSALRSVSADFIAANWDARRCSLTSSSWAFSSCTSSPLISATSWASMVSLNVASCATCASSFHTQPSSAACVCFASICSSSVSAKRSTWAFSSWIFSALLASSWASMFSLDVTSCATCASSLVSTKRSSAAHVCVATRPSVSSASSAVSAAVWLAWSSVTVSKISLFGVQ